MKILLFISIFFCGIVLLIAETIAQPSIWFKVLPDNVILYEFQKDSTIRSFLMTETNPLNSALLNGYPAICLDSSANYFTHISSCLSSAKQLMIIVAYTSKQTDSLFGIWTVRNTNHKNIFLTDKIVGNGKHRIQYSMPYEKKGNIVNASVLSLDKDAISITGNDTLYIGKGDSLLFKGEIAEFVVIKNTKLKERQQWQTYLSLKYSASMLHDNYIASWGDVLWKYSEYKKYSVGIAGIGRDDYFGLNQHQSRIYDDSVTIAINKIYKTQCEHPEILVNHDFLLWGHNGESFEKDNLPYYYQDSIRFELESRRWMMKPHILSHNTYLTEVEKVVNSGKDISRLYMLITQSEDFDSWLSGVKIYHPDSITENKAYFKNIVWNTNKEDAPVYFTFAYLHQENLSPNGFSVIENSHGAEFIFTEAEFYPNPVIDNLSISYKLTRQATISFSVYNSAGNLVCQTAPLKKDKGYDRIDINMAGLITGAYTIYIHVDDMILKHVILKK